MGESIRFYGFPLGGIDGMSACTDRVFPRHTHDQFGIGVIEAGGHTSWSDRGQVEAGPGSLICLNPGEVTDGSGVGGKGRSWRMLYLDPEVMETASAEVRDGERGSFTFEAPVFADPEVRRRLGTIFGHAAEAGCRDAMSCETALLALVARLQAHCTTRPPAAPPRAPACAGRSTGSTKTRRRS